MLIWLADWLQQFDPGFGVFSYLTLRAILSTLTALLIAVIIGPKMIRWLQRMQIGQTIRDDGPESIWPNRVHPLWVDCLFWLRLCRVCCCGAI